MLVLTLSTQLNTMAQNASIQQPNSNKEVAVAPSQASLETMYNEFIERANARIIDNEKSLVLLKTIQNIKDKEELAFYNEKVLIFEKRNNEMKSKMHDFNINSGTKAQFNEFKKRWHWGMDELIIYEKNLMTENYLNK